MSMVQPLLAKLGARYPIIQAPMGGGTSTPQLAAAVSNAGGLGSLGLAYDAPEKMVAEIRAVRALTSNPFQVNLFIPLEEQPRVAIEPMLKALASIYEELGIEAPTTAPPPWPFAFEQQMEVVIEERAAIFSFTFGLLEQRYIDALHARGTVVIGTATTMAEAEHLAISGVDAIVLQGAEAGAHRGSFLRAADDMIGLFALIPQVALRVQTPVIASGGIMDGRGICAAMALGAEAVQMGTAFLLTEESGASEIHKQAVLAAKPEETQITRAFSGRKARGIRNRFIREVEAACVEIPAFPIQNDLTRAMRRHAAKAGNPDFLSLWSGQNGSLGRRMGAAELVKALVNEAGL
ncbi:MAG: nitronate monooxygenase [Acidobacteriaceae bacterium]